MKVDRRELLAREDGTLQVVPHLKVQMNDGLYGNLLGEHNDEKLWRFVPLRLGSDGPAFSAPTLPAILNGKTCDSWDRMSRMRPLPSDLRAGDLLLVPHAGAYTIVLATDFNSAPRSQVCLFWREEQGLRCQLHDARGEEIRAQGGATPGTAPASAPAPRTGHSLAESRVLTLSRLASSAAPLVDQKLLRPGELRGPPRWEQVLSLVYRNDPVLRVEDVLPREETATGWVLQVARQGFPQPLALCIGKTPFLGDRAQRFRSEAAAVAALAEDGRIPPVLEYGILPEGQHPYHLQPCPPGRTLAQLLPELHGGSGTGRNGDWRRGARRALLEHLVEAASALAFAHGRGVVHRDLRPANILVPEQRVAHVVTGFGVELRSPVLVVGWGLFTEEPFPPEQLDSLSPERARGAPPAPADDVWALGTTLLRITCNRSLLEGLGDESERLAALRTEPQELVLRSIPAARALPPELASIIRLALQVPAQARYAGAADLAEDVQCFLDRRVVAAHRRTLAAPYALVYSALRGRQRSSGSQPSAHDMEA
jgi:serine/threonine protein kinase